MKDRRFGILKVTDTVIDDCFEEALLVFRNCLVLSVDMTEYYSQIRKYHVKTNFLPDVEIGEVVPEYLVEISWNDEKGIDEVIFISEEGKRFTAYSRDDDE